MNEGSPHLKRWFRWGPAILMMVVIYAASSLPGTALPTWPGWTDLLVKKGGHMLGYGLLVVFLRRGIGENTVGAYRLAWFMAFLYAISDEVHQMYVPGRTASVIDLIIDGVGAGIGLFLVRMVQ